MIQATLNWTFWAVLLFAAAMALCRACLGTRPLAAGWLAATAVSVLSLVIAGIGLRLAYVAPKAIIQDIVAAQQALNGQRLPTTEINPLVRRILAEYRPAAHLESVWPRFAKEEQEEYETVLSRTAEQAHPPFMTLFFVPFVYLLGVRGCSLAASVLSIGCLGLTLVLICRGLRLNLSASQRVLLSAVFLSWYPMYGVVRGGQSGAMLGALVVLSWYCIRRGRPLWGGFAIGVAASLKLFPALLLVYLALRHFRALLACMATIVLLNAVTMSLFAVQSYIDYMHTTTHLADKYGMVTTNWSLLSALPPLVSAVGIPSINQRAAFLTVSVLLVSAISSIVLINRRPGSATARFDADYSLFIAPMLLLSPICWSHYFVLMLLPLAVLANRTLREGAAFWTTFALLGLFLAVALPETYQDHLTPFVQHHISWRLGVVSSRLPSLALLGTTIWIARIKWTSLPEDAPSNPDRLGTLEIADAIA